DLALGVDEVLRGPDLVAVGVPGTQVVVLDDRVAQPGVVDRGGYVARVLLERELGRVDAHDRQALGPVLGVPRLQVGLGADAVDAGVGPEVDEDDAAAQALHRQRAPAGRVEPALGVREVGGLAQAGQRWRLY